MRRAFLWIAFLFLALAANEAAARGRSGDMFADADWAVDPNRPSVPSDAQRWRGDLFRPYPLLANRGADLFDGMRPSRTATRQDVLRPYYPVTYPVGRLFGSWADR